MLPLMDANYGGDAVYLLIHVWLCNPMDCRPPGSCPWDFPGKNTGVGCHFLLQVIFLTEGLNLHLLYCMWILYNWATWEANYGTCGFQMASSVALADSSLRIGQSRLLFQHPHSGRQCFQPPLVGSSFTLGQAWWFFSPTSPTHASHIIKIKSSQCLDWETFFPHWNLFWNWWMCEEHMQCRSASEWLIFHNSEKKRNYCP